MAEKECTCKVVKVDDKDPTGDWDCKCRDYKNGHIVSIHSTNVRWQILAPSTVPQPAPPPQPQGGAATSSAGAVTDDNGTIYVVEVICSCVAKKS